MQKTQYLRKEREPLLLQKLQRIWLSKHVQRIHRQALRSAEKPLYVCSICGNRRICQMKRAYYIAQQADAMAKRRYAEERSKPQLEAEETSTLDAIVSSLIQKRQPLTYIYVEHGDELAVGQRKLYIYWLGSSEHRQSGSAHKGRLPAEAKEKADKWSVSEPKVSGWPHLSGLSGLHGKASGNRLCGGGYRKMPLGARQANADHAVYSADLSAQHY